MSEIAWPLVDENDDGIRPAGLSDACFYCHRYVGEEHERNCCVVTRRVRVRYAFEILVHVPAWWQNKEFESHRNDSTWCADNALDEIEQYYRSGGCACGHFKAEWMSMQDSTPHRAIKDAKQCESDKLVRAQMHEGGMG